MQPPQGKGTKNSKLLTQGISLSHGANRKEAIKELSKAWGREGRDATLLPGDK